jgi:hypothetical protein
MAVGEKKTGLGKKNENSSVYSHSKRTLVCLDDFVW